MKIDHQELNFQEENRKALQAKKTSEVLSKSISVVLNRTASSHLRSTSTVPHTLPSWETTLSIHQDSGRSSPGPDLWVQALFAEPL